jgi:hypothetical protein
MAGFLDERGWESGETIIASCPGIFERLKAMINIHFPS